MAKGRGKASKGKKHAAELPDGGGKPGPPAAAEKKRAVKTFLDERLRGRDRRGCHVELQKELEQFACVNAECFEQLFEQTLDQYVIAVYTAQGEPANPAELDGPIEKMITSGQQDMRIQRAERFRSQLRVERAAVVQVSLIESNGTSRNDGPIVGSLSEMCSRDEAMERQMTRQLDKLEWKRGSTSSHAEVDLELATKKYQRSCAGKAYRSQDVRTLDACWRTMEFLMTEVLDLDVKHKPIFAVHAVPYIEIYSYLRDRTRSCRVDLHLQQPRSTTHKCFIKTHECCLRFEMLSLFLLQGQRASNESTEKYDDRLGLKAISQSLEPLLGAYQEVRYRQSRNSLSEVAEDTVVGDADRDQEYTSPFEAAIHRYIILLLMSFSAEELRSHLAKLGKDTLRHPLVAFAMRAYAAFQADDYGRFLRFYQEADFLTAIAMSGVADLARLRALWLLVRCTPPGVADKVKLSRMRNMLAFADDEHARSFLAFHSVKVSQEGDPAHAYVMLPRRSSPETATHPLLSGPARIPQTCEYLKGADSMLFSKFRALGLSRADIVFGRADPLAEVEVGGSITALAVAMVNVADRTCSADPDQ